MNEEMSKAVDELVAEFEKFAKVCIRLSSSRADAIASCAIVLDSLNHGFIKGCAESMKEAARGATA